MTTLQWETQTEWKNFQSDIRAEYDLNPGQVDLGIWDAHQDNSLDTLKWTPYIPGDGGQVVEQNSRLELLHGPDSDDRPYLRTDEQMVADAANGAAVYGKSEFTFVSTTESQAYIDLWWDGSGEGPNGYGSPTNAVTVGISHGGKTQIRKYESGSPTNLAENTSFNTQSNHTVEGYVQGSFSSFDATLVIDGATELSVTGQSFSPSANCPYSGIHGRESQGNTYAVNTRFIPESGLTTTSKKTS